MTRPFTLTAFALALGGCAVSSESAGSRDPILDVAVKAGAKYSSCTRLLLDRPDLLTLREDFRLFPDASETSAEHVRSALAAIKAGAGQTVPASVRGNSWSRIRCTFRQGLRANSFSAPVRHGDVAVVAFTSHSGTGFEIMTLREGRWEKAATQIVSLW